MQTARRPCCAPPADRTHRPGETVRRRVCDRYGHHLTGREQTGRALEHRAPSARLHHAGGTAVADDRLKPATLQPPTLWRELMGRWLGD